MKKMVISLGGSLIIPDKIDFQFLEKLKTTLRKHYKTHKFVVVCGGGSIARKYIEALEKENKPIKEVALAGIRATRMNAMFLMQFFGKEANSTLPKDISEIEGLLLKNNVVFCGALRYAKHETSDGTAVKIARRINAPFINLTDVDGLYTSNPKTNKDAKLIKKIGWKDFEKMTLKLTYKPGQHFVLDQEASIMIHKGRIITYIVGKNLSNLSRIIRDQPFVGTLIAN